MTHPLTITLSIEAQDLGRSLCQVSTSSGIFSEEPQQFHGQNPNHAIAIALENLAAHYRKAAESQQSQQGSDELAIARRPTGETTSKSYHVVLHYERITEDESIFEAVHSTIMGNTVVENAIINVVEIDPNLPIHPIDRCFPEQGPP